MTCSRPPPLVTFDPYVLRCGEALIPNNSPNWDEYIATIRGLEGIRSVSDTWAGSANFSPVVARHILNKSTSPDNDKEMAILLTQEMVLGILRQLRDDKQADIYTTLNKIEDIIVTGNEPELDSWMARDERLRDPRQRRGLREHPARSPSRREALQGLGLHQRPPRYDMPGAAPLQTRLHAPGEGAPSARRGSGLPQGLPLPGPDRLLQAPRGRYEGWSPFRRRHVDGARHDPPGQRAYPGK
jgi:hypothetical protein